jgi:hypothetical protein
VLAAPAATVLSCARLEVNPLVLLRYTVTDPKDDTTDGVDDETKDDAGDDKDSHFDTQNEPGDRDADAERIDRDDSERDVDRDDSERDVDRDDGFDYEDGYEDEDAVERDDGFVHEDAVEREGTVERGEGFVQDEREEDVEASELPREPGLSSGGEFGEPPQYFDPVTERSDELPRSMEASRSKMIGGQSLERRSGPGDQVAGGASTHAGLERARKVGTALDDAVTVPGTSFKIGLDPILGILPGGGDAVAAVGSLYIVLEAARAGVPRSALKKMLALATIDLVVGSVPLVGVLFDAAWKANKWNVATFEEHVEDDAR